MIAAVVGVGMTPFGKFPNRSLTDLAREAMMAALKDAGMLPRQVEAAFVGNVLGETEARESGLGQVLLTACGIKGTGVTNVENVCATGSTALHLAVMAVAAGQAQVALALGVEKMTGNRRITLTAGAQTLEERLGFNMPATFALKAQRYLAEFGGDPRDLAHISVKNYRHALANPRAAFRRAVTLEEVLDSPVVADPLTRLQSCPMSDGAAAVIICHPAMAARFSATPVWVAATALRTGEYRQPPELARWPLDRLTASEAYRQSALGPSDLDVVELHDAFTIAEVMHYEGLGLCPEGEGLRWAVNGKTAIGGPVPVNPSGGLLAKGHPLGATGVAQVVELTEQLRGTAGDRQVEGARVGLAHCMGGDFEGDARAATVIVLQR